MEETKNKKRYFFIDYENVHDAGLAGYELLHAEDTVFLFCSANAGKLDARILSDMQEAEIACYIRYVETGTKNALDFQLVSEVGYILGQDIEGNKCIIISNDQGYQAVRENWKKRAKNSALISIFGSVGEYLNSNTEKKPEETAKPVLDMTKTAEETVNSSVSVKCTWKNNAEFCKIAEKLNLNDSDAQELYDIKNGVNGFPDASQRLPLLNKAILHKFGSGNKAVAIYRLVKPLIK